MTQIQTRDFERLGIVWDSTNSKFVKNPLAVGDIVQRVTKPSSIYSKIKRDDITSVTDIASFSQTGDYVREPGANGNWEYKYVYIQKIRVTGSNQTYNSDNFIKQRGLNMLTIDVDRPTFVREFNETTTDGKVTREYVGDWIQFDNLSAAQVYCSNQISDSIRGSNTYRKFSIVVEKSVAQAKKPEIEFA